MRQREVELIRESFALVLRAGDAAPTAFYRRLFEIAPETRRMFKDDTAEQERLLILALARIVTGLSHQADVAPALCELARRHVGYGVRIEHYALIGDALMHMIEQVTPLDDQTRMAWSKAGEFVTGTMIAAAYGCAAGAASSAAMRSAA